MAVTDIHQVAQKDQRVADRLQTIRQIMLGSKRVKEPRICQSRQRASSKLAKTKKQVSVLFTPDK